MHYISKVLPLDGYRLFMEMEGGSSVTVAIAGKLHTVKYGDLSDEALFRNVKTDGNYVIWGDGRVKLTVDELMEVALMG
jgi:hypothetical protein